MTSNKVTEVRSFGDIWVMAQFKKNEWCHLCGFRGDSYFAEVDLPEDAEHQQTDPDMPNRYLRICSRCLDRMKLEIVREVEKDF